MKKDEREKNALQPSLQLAKSIIPLCIVLFIGVILVVNSFKGGTAGGTLYSYDVKKSSSYKVYLNDNSYFEEPFLVDDKAYVANLVDHIDVDVKYDYSSVKNTQIDYTYQIVGDVVVKSDYTNTKDSVLWTKRYTLLEPKTINKTDSKFSIVESVSVEYGKYNSYVKKLVSNLNVQANAQMDIKLIISGKSKIDNDEFTKVEETVIDLQMDLLKDTFKIVNNYAKNDSGLKTEDATEGTINQPLIVLGTVIVFVAGIGLVLVMSKVFKDREENYYKIKTEKILNKYEEQIARVVKPINIDDRQVVDVKNFQQLLEIEEEIRIPILFYETIPGQKGEFVIIYDNIAYRYIIRGRKWN